MKTTKPSSLGISCELIKENIDILSFCEQNYNAVFVPGRKGWYNTNCLMPDHEDLDPSFGVNIETNTYHCFGCGAKGSVIDLVMSVEEMDLGQATRFLLDYLDIQPDIASSKFYNIKKILKQNKSKVNRDILLEAKIKTIAKNRHIIDNKDYYKSVVKLLRSYANDSEREFIKKIYAG